MASSYKSLKVLRAIDSQTIKNLVNKLNTDGFVTDECDVGLLSTMIEKWDKSCEDYLKTEG